jgi:hypothetical protein
VRKEEDKDEKKRGLKGYGMEGGLPGEKEVGRKERGEVGRRVRRERGRQLGQEERVAQGEGEGFY